MSDADSTLRERIAQKLAEEGPTDESTESEAMHGDDDEMDDEEEDGMEMDAVTEDMEEAMQTIAESSGEDITPTQVQEMLSPLFEGEDTRDDPAEMAAESGDGETTESEGLTEEEVREIATEAVSEAVPDNLVTADDLDEKLDGVADDVESVVQEADVSTTPTPSAGSVDTTPALFSDEGGD